MKNTIKIQLISSRNPNVQKDISIVDNVCTGNKGSWDLYINSKLYLNSYGNKLIISNKRLHRKKVGTVLGACAGPQGTELIVEIKQKIIC